MTSVDADLRVKGSLICGIERRFCRRRFCLGIYLGRYITYGVLSHCGELSMEFVNKYDLNAMDMLQIVIHGIFLYFINGGLK